MGRKLISFKYVATALLTIAALILVALNIQQKRLYLPPDDGASWVVGASGVQARVVVEGGPADRAGIQPGDILKAIDDDPVRNDLQVTQFLYKIGSWQKAKYTVLRKEQEI